MSVEVEVHGDRVYLPHSKLGFNCENSARAQIVAEMIRREILKYTGVQPGTAESKPARWQCGVLFRWGSAWLGAHWSPYNRRLCVNLLPCVTVWVALPGGKAP